MLDLKIIATPHQVFLGTIDVKNNEIVDYYQQNIALHQYPLLWNTLPDAFKNQTFKNTTLLFHPTYFTLLPSALFTPSNLEAITESIAPKNSIENPEYQTNKNGNIGVIFDTNKEISSFFKSINSPNSTKIPLPLFYLNQHTFPTDVKIVLHKFDQITYYIVYKDNNLIFLNSFKTITIEDCIYFLLYIQKETNIEWSQTEVILYGQFESNSSLLSRINDFVPTVSVGINKSQFDPIETFGEAHKFFEFLTQLS